VKQGVTHPQVLSQLDRARCFVARVKLEEFLLGLAQHPACAYSRKIGLAMSPEAIAQHYEIATDRIDLTQDPDVAAFFATHTRDARGWHPLATGTGVIYRMNFPDLRATLHDPSDLEWIGKQALPRPGEQKAWTLRLPLGCDFEKGRIDVLTFNHQESCGRRLSDQFRAGALLFPPDRLSAVADSIRLSASIPRSLVSKVLTLQGRPAHLHERELEASAGYLAKNVGIAVVDREPIALSTIELAAADLDVERAALTFLDDVGVRPMRQAKLSPGH
jgi:hypothetical protein